MDKIELIRNVLTHPASLEIVPQAKQKPRLDRSTLYRIMFVQPNGTIECDRAQWTSLLETIPKIARLELACKEISEDTLIDLASEATGALLELARIETINKYMLDRNVSPVIISVNYSELTGEDKRRLQQKQYTGILNVAASSNLCPSLMDFFLLTAVYELNPKATLTHSQPQLPNQTEVPFVTLSPKKTGISPRETYDSFGALACMGIVRDDNQREEFRSVVDKLHTITRGVWDTNEKTVEFY